MLKKAGIDSNTTNVKVKLSKVPMNGDINVYSNTTNVKVKQSYIIVVK